MKKQFLNIACFCALVLGMGSCDYNEIAIEQPNKKEMTFNVVHPNEQVSTRVNGNAFEANDQIGVYVTDRDAPLEIGGNYVNNAKLTYSSNAWKPESPIYWNNGTYNVYAYYPYAVKIPAVNGHWISPAAPPVPPRSTNDPSAHCGSFPKVLRSAKYHPYFR